MWAIVYRKAGVSSGKELYQVQKHGENRKISHVGRGKGKIEGSVALVGGIFMRKTLVLFKLFLWMHF